MLDNMYYQKNKGPKVSFLTLVLLSSFFVFKENTNASEHGEFKLEEAVCPECKFFNGNGVLRFFGLRVYNASLFSESKSGEIFDAKFSLQINYFRDLNGKDIAKRSFKEMKRLKLIPEGEENLWYDWMEKNFPDIKKNDKLTGVFIPDSGIMLHHNGILIASKSDKNFAKSFFLIWLDGDTSQPRLRQELLKFRHND